MLIGIFTIVIILSIFLTFLKVKNNFVSKYFYLFYSIFISALATSSGDTDSYEFIFDSIKNGVDFNLIYGEYGYKYILKFFSLFTDDYKIVVFVLMTVTMMLIFRFINYYCKDTRLVYSMYLIYPFLNDAGLIRNTLAMALILTAIDFFLKKKIKSSFVILFLATTIHTLSWTYFLIYMTGFKLKIKAIVGSFLVVTAVGLFLNNFGILSYAFNRVDAYSDMGGTSQNFGYLVHMVADILVVFCLWVMNKEVKGKLDVKSSVFLNFTLKLHILLLATLPLLMLNLQFYRIYRNLLVTVFISFSIYLNAIKKNYKGKYFVGLGIYLFYLFLVIGLFSIYVGKSQYFEVGMYIINSNLLVEYIFN